MKRSIKTLPNISGLHDVRSYTGTVRKSGKPSLPTTAILDLYMRRSERDRIERELKGLKRRKKQLQKRSIEVEKEMTKLLEKATKTAVDIRGTSLKRKAEGVTRKKERLVLEY